MLSSTIEPRFRAAAAAPRDPTLLLQQLLRASLQLEATADEAGLLSLLERAGEEERDELMATLESHRLLPLVGATLHARGLEELVPAPHAKTLRRAQLLSFRQNGAHLRALDQVLRELDERGVPAVLLKGAALVNGLYPTLGSRPMRDVDVLVPAAALAEVEAAVLALGFWHASTQADTINYVRPPGIALDVHHRLRIFDGTDLDRHVVALEPRFLCAERVGIFDADVTLVHLVAHMEGHRPETGYMLLWLVDLALAIQQRGHELDPRRLRSLAADEAAYRRILRAAGFVRDVLGVALPAELAGEAAGVPPIGLGEVLRGRRLAVWGLPRPKGWLRLAAHFARVRPRPERPLPRWRDLLGGLGDRGHSSAMQ